MSDVKSEVLKLFDPDGELIILGTADGDIPYVRYLIAHVDEELHTYFATYRETPKVAQIKANPKVCFVVGGDKEDWRKPYARIFGHCEEITDLELKKGIWKPVYANFFSGPEDDNFVLFRVEPTRIEFNDPLNDRVEILER